ncbi:MAG: glycosyltransferase [Armatimonadetes bacterium]|nr:glycosyltransferase [Akkermansiaceae bacterium]
MPRNPDNQRWHTDGKFFRRGDKRIWMRAVTYGPFPPGKTPICATEFRKVRDAGFDTLRVFDLPDRGFLDAANHAGLQVFAGLDWRYLEDFISKPALFSAARIKLSNWLKSQANHPALSGVYVGNEIPAEMVRWMSPVAVRNALEELIDMGRGIAPHLLFAYANYPSTEYLEPANADFSAFNIYLEEPSAFAEYLRRLHNIAGDRALVVSEFGMDSARNTVTTQADVLRWGMDISFREETAGITVYSWSDLWENNGVEILDWDFGITDRKGNPKSAYDVCSNWKPEDTEVEISCADPITIIICTRNGRNRIGRCLKSIENLNNGPYEILVVDDGSHDGTSGYISENFPNIRTITIPWSGLSNARNIGAAAANGEIFAFTDDDCEPDQDWLLRLRKAFQDPAIAAAGGPNLPPAAKTWEESVIRASPGAPSHVLLDDSRAEHLPGCNIAVRRLAFESVGGFDPSFRTAGDDVDFCWRLSDAGYHLGFVPGAFVWHRRRPSVGTFLKQQIGYGKAEKLLLAKHPGRFSKSGEARWNGFVYGGGPVRAGCDSIIYQGRMGRAGYQSIVNRILPLRPIDSAFRNPFSDFVLSVVGILQPALRRWARNRSFKFPLPELYNQNHQPPDNEFQIEGTNGEDREHYLELLLGRGWQPGGSTDPWDLYFDDTRVLIATEKSGPFRNNNLFRVWGSTTSLQEALAPALIRP